MCTKTHTRKFFHTLVLAFIATPALVSIQTNAKEQSLKQLNKMNPQTDEGYKSSERILLKSTVRKFAIQKTTNKSFNEKFKDPSIASQSQNHNQEKRNNSINFYQATKLQLPASTPLQARSSTKETIESSGQKKNNPIDFNSGVTYMGILDHGSTNGASISPEPHFTSIKRNGTKLTGTYNAYSWSSESYTGVLTQVSGSEANPTFLWEDKYGTGYLTIKFSAEKDYFFGTWTVILGYMRFGIELKQGCWNGSKSEFPSPKAEPPLKE